MPISDVDGYDSGHFKRVYEHIIKPACILANFKPIRADDVVKTNVIVIDILQNLLNAEMALCDLSSQNPNVLYELGIRQAFNLPVCFIKDDITERIFDIQGYRDLEYQNMLRIDEVESAVTRLATALVETYNGKDDEVNSIIRLLGITKAKKPKELEISQDTNLILKSIGDLASRIGKLEKTPSETGIVSGRKSIVSFRYKNETFNIGDIVKHERFGQGELVEATIDQTDTIVMTVRFDELGKKQLMAKFVNLEKIGRARP